MRPLLKMMYIKQIRVSAAQRAAGSNVSQLQSNSFSIGAQGRRDLLFNLDSSIGCVVLSPIG